MANSNLNSNLFGENISLVHQEFVAAYKERFLCENTHVASVKSSKLWQKMSPLLGERIKHSQISSICFNKKMEARIKVRFSKKRHHSKKGKLISFVYSIKINCLRFSFVIYKYNCDSLTLL